MSQPPSHANNIEARPDSTPGKQADCDTPSSATRRPRCHWIRWQIFVPVGRHLQAKPCERRGQGGVWLYGDERHEGQPLDQTGDPSRDAAVLIDFRTGLLIFFLREP